MNSVGLYIVKKNVFEGQWSSLHYVGNRFWACPFITRFFKQTKKNVFLFSLHFKIAISWLLERYKIKEKCEIFHCAIQIMMASSVEQLLEELLILAILKNMFFLRSISYSFYVSDFCSFTVAYRFPVTNTTPLPPPKKNKTIYLGCFPNRKGLLCLKILMCTVTYN